MSNKDGLISRIITVLDQVITVWKQQAELNVYIQLIQTLEAESFLCYLELT